ncbi:mitochondrial import receptor subunit TOM70 [Mayamaea pseudoterrestris]|nr:mitochondrial import receptor subunit TOM70 [Mayamaea pseudoterrestris]
MANNALARHNLRSTQIALFSLATVFSLSFLWYYFRRASKSASPSSQSLNDQTSSKGKDATTTQDKPASRKQPEERKTPTPDEKEAIKTSSKEDEKALHAEIEELDKKGKAFFKAKQFLDAAQAFTDALDLIGSSTEGGSTALQKQAITLLNNRSAMYEKANLPELSLEDCNTILETDPMHVKARTRKLRMLENVLHRPFDALVEVCASQLLHMRQHRNTLRMGLPIPPPPVSESKLHELLTLILPEAVAPYEQELEKRSKAVLPSPYTIVQLLKSYTGYNAWMADAARSGSASSMVIPDEASDAEAIANRATMLMKRGQRYVYDGRYDLASADFEQGFACIENAPDQQAAIDAMPDGAYARLLEWTGMVRHWHYNLEGSMAVYRKCADVEPTNALLLVKQAGVQMDKAELDEAYKLFDMALGIDPDNVDALLHRSNLKMLQSKAEEAKTDLLKCLELKPNHVMARLRLASLFASTNDIESATRQLDMAENEDPKSSDVKSHRGELLFTQNKMEEAREQFEMAIELEPGNPTPYVNCAMTILNTPPGQGQMPDTAAIMDFLERAIEVDSQFTAAYMQLGQLALGTATDLNAAKEVIKLYDNGLANCRTKEEIKELVSMRTLAVAQVDAATMLGMETFNMQ